ncbi:PstS family phosphate ABC transporter substrate-binding protein [Embleya sp. NBC_00896]|uniref:PstS family phosphate ABC transporter substrate-binding protein n=1 Tax=Embleya sp. NBC_00896 TaxID=2975961 RepID=UPI00386C52B5|nr:substrate-binding domain-containing protein [Embleya sp. NBC_00896]
MRKTATVLGTAGAAMALVVGANASANAATYVNAGSDTLQNVTAALGSDYEANVDPGGNSWITVNAGVPAGGQVTGKTACNTQYGPGTNAWPNGSSAGINALLAERAGTSANCLNFARSSRGPKAGTPETTLTFVRVAGDAVTWATKKAGAPSSLTSAQLKGIYNCSITNWNQINSGLSGQIQKHIPQLGSGTRQEFIDKVLGFDPTAASNGACAATVIQTAQENRGDAPQITSLDAIIPYSQAAYGEQTTPASGVTNHTNGFTPRGIDGKAPNAAGFVGNRSVYYVYDPADTENDADTIAFINWAKAPAQLPIWTTFGFVA